MAKTKNLWKDSDNYIIASAYQAVVDAISENPSGGDIAEAFEQYSKLIDAKIKKLEDEQQ